jgi:amidase
MAVPRPDRDDVAALARSYGLQHTDAELDTYALLVAGSFDAYEAVEQLYAAIRPEPPADRPVTWPGEADNPLGARWPGGRWRSRTTPRSPASR